MIQANMDDDGKCPNCGANMRLPTAPRPERGTPRAYIEHHKGGDNLVWDKTNLPCTPLYERNEP